jgi:hypothetical protein
MMASYPESRQACRGHATAKATQKKEKDSSFSEEKEAKRLLFFGGFTASAFAFTKIPAEHWGASGVAGHE